MERSQITVAFDRKELTDRGEFEGFGSVYYNVDGGADVVHPGAFAESIGKRRPLMLWQHDWSKPIGVWTQVEEREAGLWVRGRLALDTTLGRDAHALLKLGALDGLSIGFLLQEWDYSDDGVRHIRKAELWEVSVVTFPMNDRARVAAVKGKSGYDFRDVRTLEAFLRDAGMSHKAAKALIAGGHAALIERDVDPAAAASAATREALEAAERLSNIIRSGTP